MKIHQLITCKEFEFYFSHRYDHLNKTSSQIIDIYNRVKNEEIKFDTSTIVNSSIGMLSNYDILIEMKSQQINLRFAVLKDCLKEIQQTFVANLNLYDNICTT